MSSTLFCVSLVWSYPGTHIQVRVLLLQRFVEYYIVSFMKGIRASCDLDITITIHPGLGLAKKLRAD